MRKTLTILMSFLIIAAQGFTFSAYAADETFKITVSGEVVAEVAAGESYTYEEEFSTPVSIAIATVNGEDLPQDNIHLAADGRSVAIELGPIYEDIELLLGISPMIHVIYAYAEDDLPDEVMATLPPDGYLNPSVRPISLSAPSQQEIETPNGAYIFSGWTFEDGTWADGETAVKSAQSGEITVYAVWSKTAPAPSVFIGYAYDKEYPEEVMATLPESTEYTEITTASPEQPSSRFLRVGNTFYLFEGWDKDSLSTQTDGTFMGSWVVFNIPEEYSRSVYVKFIDKQGSPITSGSFTDSLYTGDKPPYSLKDFNHFYSEELNEFISVGKGSADPSVLQEEPNKYSISSGYTLRSSRSVTIREDGYSEVIFSNNSDNYTFSELETPEGYKALESSITANFNLINGTISIIEDETGRAYVDGNTLYIVYIPIDKEGAKEDLDSYVNPDDYADEQKEEIAQIIDDAKNEIDNASTQEELEDITKEAKSRIDKIKTKAQLEEEALNAAKDAAKAELAEIDTAKYSGEPSDEQSSEEDKEAVDSSTDANSASDADDADDLDSTESESDKDTASSGSTRSTSPKTEDSTSAPLFVGLLSISLIAFLIAIRKKLNRKEE